VSVTVSYGSLVSFLDTQVDREDSSPTTETTGLCLVAGGLVGGNLEDELARREIPTASLDVSTIEATARGLLDSHHSSHTDTPEPVEILDQQLCEALLVDAITTAPDSGSVGTVASLLSGFDWAGRPTLRDTLWRELDRYFRMTDAGQDHEAARAVATDLAASDPYAGSRSKQALDAFQELHTALQRRTDDLPKTAYLSRSHLVSAAREALAAEWRACYPDVDWVAVDTISVLDNPTLRFFETLAQLEDGPDLYVFGTETGAGSRVYNRLDATSLDPDLTQGETDEPDTPHVAGLMETVQGEPPDSLPNVEFVETPDGRRELDHVAGRIRELTGMGVDSEGSGTTCGDIVIAAKDVIPYRSRIADVFTSHEIPTHIEARQPLMQTVPYRYLRAVVDLLAAVANGTPITTQELVDPIRLGFCPPETAAASGTEWPVDGETAAGIETQLDTVGPAADEEGQPFADWVGTIEAELPPAELPAMAAFIEWVDKTADTPPASGEGVVGLIESLLDAHLRPLTSRGVRRPTGPGIDGTRTALTTKHDSHVVARLRGEADRVGSYVDQAVTTELADPGWEAAAEAVRQVCGSGSYWPRNADGNAVRIINAANAHYVDADHVFVIGLAAEEFPAERSPPNVFHEGFYRAIREVSETATDATASAYLHAPTSQSQFEGDIDEYRAAISAATEGVWLCRQFRTTEGEAVPWSGFVDAYTSQADAEIQRIAMDEWLPTADSEEGGGTAIRTATPRDRLRLLSATFPGGINADRGRSTASLTEKDAIADLLSRADGDAYSSEIEPRRRRYLGEDIQSITVSPDEPIVSDRGGSVTPNLSLADITGPPIRPHELDLYTNCQLKFYFYQYLNTGGIDRDRVADLPTQFGNRYPSQAFSDGLRRLISSTDHLADRQAAFSRYDSLGAFRDQLASWIETDPALDSSLMQPMLGEYRAVQQELDANIDRGWRWEPATTVRIDGHAVRVPGHRVDVLPNAGFSIPVWYTGAEGAAKGVVSRSLPSQIPISERDHRLLLGAETVDTFGGSLVYDPTSAAASAPRGILIGGDLNPIPNGIPDTSNLTRISRSEWDTWRESAVGSLETMTSVDEPITYEISDAFIDHGGCVGCDYRELCQVPASRQRGEK
jgi:ATP-dependent helicase/nuclease subunit B